MTRFALALPILLFACAQVEAPPPAGTPKRVAQPEARFVDRSLPGKELDEVEPREQAAFVEAQLRVRPDHRVLMALGDIHELATGKRVNPEISFEQGRWNVRVGGTTAGSLPEIPSFADGMDLLVRFASSQPLPKENRQADASAFEADALFAAAKNASPSTLADVAALINLQTIDQFGFADPLRARGLALVAIAHAAGADTARAEAILADSMGYQREGSIPRGLPAKAEAYLDAAATIRRSDRAGRMTLAANVPARWLPLFTVNTDMHETASVAHAAARVIAAEAAGDRQFGGKTAGETLAASNPESFAALQSTMDAALPSHSSALASSAFPAAVVRAYYQAQFQTTIHAAFEDLVYRYGDASAARSFVEELGHPSAAEAAQARDWLLHALDAKYGGAKTNAFAALNDLPLVSATMRAWLLEHFIDAAGAHDTHVRRALLALYPQLDSRPFALRKAGHLAHMVLQDPRRRDLYFEASIAAAPWPGSQAWLAALQGDEAGLRRIAESAASSADDRATALLALGRLSEKNHSYVVARYESLLQKGGYGYFMRLAPYLNERRDWKTKERLARRALEHFANADRVTMAWYASSLGDALENLGRYEEGWKIVEPHLEVFSANILEQGVALMERRGDVDGAIALGRRMIERYPGAAMRAELAKVFWRRDRHTEAAELFSRAQRLDSYGLRTDVPQTFVTVFRDRRPADAATALDAMVARDVDQVVVLDTLRHLRETELHEHVVAAVEKLAARPEWQAGRPGGATAIAHGFASVRESSGEAAASAWLRPRVPDSAAVQFVTVAFSEHEDELVLAWATPRPDLARSIEMQAFVAMALTRARVAADDARRAALLAQVRAMAPNARSLLAVSQYLLGLMSEEEFLRWPYVVEARATSAWVVGLKSAAEGDYEKALPWMIAASYGGDANPSARWAGNMLALWNRERASWEEVKRRGRL